MRKSYDSKSYELAKYFLSDLEGDTATDANKASLAQCIQDAVEDWFFEGDRSTIEPKEPEDSDLMAHVQLCPWGWINGRVVSRRADTDADLIEWLKKLRQLSGLDSADAGSGELKP